MGCWWWNTARTTMTSANSIRNSTSREDTALATRASAGNRTLRLMLAWPVTMPAAVPRVWRVKTQGK